MLDRNVLTCVLTQYSDLSYTPLKPHCFRGLNDNCIVFVLWHSLTDVYEVDKIIETPVRTMKYDSYHSPQDVAKINQTGNIT